MTVRLDKTNSIKNRQLSVVDNKIESDEIFVNSRELSILHNGYEYKLRLTGNGKLILTK
ncbi:MAG: hemin uptake protein HemP [Sneathiella sp.]|nr:hemin uptake protein HemP [Sneathiella sp.]